MRVKAQREAAGRRGGKETRRELLVLLRLALLLQEQLLLLFVSMVRFESARDMIRRRNDAGVARDRWGIRGWRKEARQLVLLDAVEHLRGVEGEKLRGRGGAGALGGGLGVFVGGGRRGGGSGVVVGWEIGVVCGRRGWGIVGARRALAAGGAGAAGAGEEAALGRGRVRAERAPLAEVRLRALRRQLADLRTGGSASRQENALRPAHVPSRTRSRARELEHAKAEGIGVNPRRKPRARHRPLGVLHQLLQRRRLRREPP